jgi:hypothetical protein
MDTNDLLFTIFRMGAGKGFHKGQLQLIFRLMVIEPPPVVVLL